MELLQQIPLERLLLLIFVAGGRVRVRPRLGNSQNMIQFFATGSMTFDGPLSNAVIVEPPVNVAGWQWCTALARVVNPGDQHYTLRLNVGSGDTDFWGMTVAKVPAATPPYDVYEFLGTLKHQPYYLAAGMSGTMEGGKLIAHGGLGSAKKYTVGVASGNITLTGANGKAFELFDEAGNSLGVAVLQGFTVNP